MASVHFFRHAIHVYEAYLNGANLSGSILADVYHHNTATWNDPWYYTDNEPTWASFFPARVLCVYN